MDNVEMREKASKAASERRETKTYTEIPQDIDFATLEDLEDISGDKFTVVPVQGVSGKWHNWLIRQLTAAERSSLDRTMFPKTVLNKAKNIAAQGGKKNNEKVKEAIINSVDADQMEVIGFRRDCLTIKKATVFPKKITTEHIEKLSASDFDRLLEAANRDINSDDDVARFSTDNGRPEDDNSSEDEV